MKCSECGNYVPFKRVCPICGGRMRAVESISDTRPFHEGKAYRIRSG